MTKYNNFQHRRSTALTGTGCRAPVTSAGRTVLFGVAGVVAICAFSTVGMGIFSVRIMLDKVSTCITCLKLFPV